MIVYAMDALAAIDALRRRTDIDTARVGLWGISQAGWIIPIAAAVSPATVKFTIIVSGPTVSIGEENFYSELTGDDRGAPTNTPREEIRRRMRAYEPQGLDAYPFIEEMRRPGLWLFGSLDQSVPWEQGVEDLQRIAARWNRDFTWQVFEGANHGLKFARTGGSWERPAPTRTVDGYFATMDRWLRDHVGVPVKP
jgi:dienelactone hydrolase